MSDRPPARRALPILGDDAGRAVGVAGVLACTLCCLSIPGTAAALSAVGLGLLRNDRILLPGTVTFAAIAIATLIRARTRHRRWTPLLVAVVAVALVWAGLRTSGGAIPVTAGDLALLGAVVWDARQS
jgi:hypothetical protein